VKSVSRADRGGWSGHLELSLKAVNGPVGRLASRKFDARQQMKKVGVLCRCCAQRALIDKKRREKGGILSKALKNKIG